MSERRLPLYFANPERSRRSHEEHMRIFESLAKRDSANAMSLMSAHLQGVESYWNGLLDEQHPSEKPQPEAAWLRHITS